MARSRLRRSRSGPQREHRLFLILLVLGAVGALAAAGSRLEDTPVAGSQPPAPKRSTGAPGRTLTIAWATRPGSLDPAFAADPTSANLVLNLFDPLVRLDDDLQPIPTFARGWEVSADRRTVTFDLRRDGRWSDGTRLTAHDFAYAWKRVVSPDLDSPFASELYAIEGAAAYHACSRRCERLADRVGVRAKDDYELVVRLAVPEPWFVARTAHHAFLPVPADVVARLGRDWSSERAIVTSGPFTLAAQDEDSIVLAKDARWRAAARVGFERVEGRVIEDALARVQAFDAGEVDVLDGAGLPTSDVPALRERREYEVYPRLATYYYGFNVASVRDVHQRRAMSLAVDRQAIIENVAGGSELPASAFTPPVGYAGIGGGEPTSPWAPPERDLDAARAELERAASVKRRLTLLYLEGASNRDVASALADAWRDLGLQTTIASRPAGEYAEARPVETESVDLYQDVWAAEEPEAIEGLDLWTCGAAANDTNFCDPRIDRLVARARQNPSAPERAVLYARAEEIMSGPSGSFPFLPLYWDTYANLEALAVRQSFAINPLGQIDLASVAAR